MTWLILLAAKSLVIAGGALLLLKLMQKRSAADRSWIAHLALAALLLLPFASFAPALNVVGPEALVGKAEVQSATSVPPSALDRPVQSSVAATPVHETMINQPKGNGAPVDWPFWGYIAPAALLLLLTLISLARLVILKARATVLVDAPWLTALARAQKRMGFKHGTALLTSNELPSPISWGVVRPVILLNSEAAKSHEEAEAIITHELAHVARLDWAKLLLARVAVALFWYNPFVWLLSREAHQLREEAADDAVLATDIDGAEYASLLVGVARHECRGILIGAHGVAPGRNSLTRRVKRVLDSAVPIGAWQSFHPDSVAGHRKGPHRITAKERRRAVCRAGERGSVQQRHEMVGRRNRKIEIGMFRHPEDALRVAGHDMRDCIVKPVRPVSALIGLVPVNLSKIVYDISARQNQDSAVA